MIEKLQKEYPHSIRLIEEQPQGRKFNCHTFAFGLRTSPLYARIVDCFKDDFVYAGNDYVNWLIANKLRERTAVSVQNDDHVVYFDGQVAAPSGTWQSGKVWSKWGDGHLWEHALAEVPGNYGNEVSYYSRMPIEQCESAFLEFTRIKVPEIYEAKLSEYLPELG